MARQKVKLAFIEDKVKRRATYKKRAEGFMTKVRELSTLCGINACAIVYSLFDAEPRVWPNDLGVHYVISQFSNMSLMDKTKNMHNQATFMKHRIVKVNEQLRKKENENREKRIMELMWKCLVGKTRVQNLSQPDLDNLGRQVELKLTEINNKMEALKGTTTLQQVSHPWQPTFAGPPIPMALQQVGPPPPPALPQPLMPMAMQQPLPALPQPLMPMAMQQIGPPPPPALPQPLMPMTVQQVAPSLPESEMYPWIIDWINQPSDEGFGQVEGNYQIIMPVANYSNTPWSRASYDHQVWANPPPNPYVP